MAEKLRKTAVLRLFDHLFGATDKIKSSWRQLNSCLQDALSLAIRAGLKFHKDDFFEVQKAYDGGYWMGTPTEQWYSRSIEAGNTSACQSYENWYGRPPFMCDGKRLHIGSEIVWESAKAEVTSFGEDHRGHFVGCCTYKPRKECGYGKTVATRFKIHLDELRKGEREKEPPKREKLLLECLKWFPEIGRRYSGSFTSTAMTLKELWEKWDSPHDLKCILGTLKFPVLMHVANAWGKAGDVRASVGDFDTNLLPLILEELKRRKDAAKAQKQAKASEEAEEDEDE